MHFMNKVTALFCFCFVIALLTIASNQTLAQAQATEDITQALQDGSSKSLGKFLNETVTLNVNNNVSDYSKNQAELILREFFRKNPPKELQILHQDESTDKSWHFIGRYRSETADFRILVKGAKPNGLLRISTLEFTKE